MRYPGTLTVQLLLFKCTNAAEAVIVKFGFES